MKTGDLLYTRLRNIVVWNAADPNSGEARHIYDAGPFICCGTCPGSLDYLTIILLPDGTLASAHTAELRLVQ
jgi:hypothetical protein